MTANSKSRNVFSSYIHKYTRMSVLKCAYVLLNPLLSLFYLMHNCTHTCTYIHTYINRQLHIYTKDGCSPVLMLPSISLCRLSVNSFPLLACSFPIVCENWCAWQMCKVNSLEILLKCEIISSSYLAIKILGNNDNFAVCGNGEMRERE